MKLTKEEREEIKNGLVSYKTLAKVLGVSLQTVYQYASRDMLTVRRNYDNLRKKFVVLDEFTLKNLTDLFERTGRPIPELLKQKGGKHQ